MLCVQKGAWLPFFVSGDSHRIFFGNAKQQLAGLGAASLAACSGNHISASLSVLAKTL